MPTYSNTDQSDHGGISEFSDTYLMYEIIDHDISNEIICITLDPSD